jgi:hypothetical protein
VLELVALGHLLWHALSFLSFWVPHVLGIDTQLSPFYDFWSGFAASGAAWLAIAFAWYSLRIELAALKLETQLLTMELEKARGEVEAMHDPSPVVPRP